VTARAQKVRDDMRAAIWNETRGMCDALLAECGEDKERKRVFISLLEDAHEYALLQLKLRKAGI
jgi:hypothetical protein